MGFVSRHVKRDQELPIFREQLLNRALEDLTSDQNVLAIYLGGSLGRGNYDAFSDIDLHTI
ncbi:MAG: nucleotidyltransferase domain-containing protein, partial [Paenisporosarcina sp.]